MQNNQSALSKSSSVMSQHGDISVQCPKNGRAHGCAEDTNNLRPNAMKTSDKTRNGFFIEFAVKNLLLRHKFITNYIWGIKWILNFFTVDSYILFFYAIQTHVLHTNSSMPTFFNSSNVSVAVFFNFRHNCLFHLKTFDMTKNRFHQNKSALHTYQINKLKITVLIDKCSLLTSPSLFTIVAISSIEVIAWVTN
jgi:hypothetical protein